MTSADVIAVLQPIWTRKHVAARKVHQRIGAVMRWAIAQGYRTDNPAGDPITAALPRRPAPVRHHRALPHHEVVAALLAVRDSGAWAGTRLALELLVLTATRSAEVRLATWRVWTIPASRMKAKRGHRVPLSGRSAEVLGEAAALRPSAAPDELVFTGVVSVCPPVGRPVPLATASSCCSARARLRPRSSTFSASLSACLYVGDRICYAISGWRPMARFATPTLPPVPPVVIYNGCGSWTARAEVSEGGEGRRADVFATRPGITQVVRLPERSPAEVLGPAQLKETYTMLEDTVQGWFEEGRVQGIEQGRVQGIEQGRVQGIEQGIEQGCHEERALLCRQAACRFGGDTSERLATELAGVTDPDRLAQVGDWIIECATTAELLARVDDAFGPLAQLKETYATLEDTVQGWIALGRVEGIKQGRVEGIEQGRVQGIEQGIEQARTRERARLCRQAARKFGGDTSERLAAALAGATDPDRLAQVGDWIVECMTAAELIARVLDEGRLHD